jgi:hypothetical protein
MAKLATFTVVLLIAVAVASIPSANGAHTLETVEHVNLPAVVASSPTTEITFDVASEEEAEGPTAPGPDTVGYYNHKTPITGPL